MLKLDLWYEITIEVFEAQVVSTCVVTQGPLTGHPDFLSGGNLDDLPAVTEPSLLNFS